MPCDVFVLGSFVVDAAYRVPRLPSDGETVLGTGFQLGPGGKGSNQAVAAARAGARVALLTKVGQDAFGDLGRRTWEAEGIDTTHLVTGTVPTGSAAILIDEVSGQNAIAVVPGGCGTLTADEVEAAKPDLCTAKVFLAQLEVPMAAVERGLKLARGAGVTTILNPAPARILPAHLLPLVDLLIPNEVEAAQLTGLAAGTREEVVAAGNALLRLGVGKVILTLGNRGAYFCDKDRKGEWLPPFTAGRVVDTTGAGDSFCGAFAAALGRDQSCSAAARFASAAAGISVTRHGAAPSAPAREEIEALLQQSS